MVLATIRSAVRLVLTEKIVRTYALLHNGAAITGQERIKIIDPRHYGQVSGSTSYIFCISRADAAISIKTGKNVHAVAISNALKILSARLLQLQKLRISASIIPASMHAHP